MDFDPRLSIEERADVYRPSDDSYLLLAVVDVSPEETFLEVGTGTGFVAIHAARGARRAVATDVHEGAVRLARANAERSSVPLSLVRTDLFAGLRGPFDVVAFNPPYLEGPPEDDQARAWSGGEEGSEVAVRFVEDLPGILSPRGRAYLILTGRNRSAWEAAGDRFRIRIRATKSLFFEQLFALELLGPA